MEWSKDRSRVRARIKLDGVVHTGRWSDDLAQALKDRDKIRSEKGRLGGPVRTLQDCVDRRIAQARADRLTEKTIKDQISYLGERMLSLWEGDSVMSSIDEKEIGDYIHASIEAGRSPNSILAKDLPFLAQLHRIAETDPNPVPLVRDRLKRTLRRVAPKKDFFTPDELRTVLSRILHDDFEDDPRRRQRDYDLFLLLVTTGIRAHELHRIPLGDIDLERKVIHVRTPKDRSNPRTQPVPASTLPSLRRLLESAKGDRLMSSKSQVDSLCRRWNRRLKVSKLNPRALRHTYVTSLLYAGVPAIEVMHLAGHKHLSTTQEYIHEIESRRAAAMPKLEALLNPREGCPSDEGDPLRQE